MLSLDAERTEVFAKIREPSVERKRLGGFPARKFGDFVLHGKAQGQLQRGEPDSGSYGLWIELLAKENVRKGSLAVKVGMGVDEVPELFGLKATATIADPVDSRFKAPFLPWGADVVVIQENRIPEVKIHGKPVRLNVQEKRGGEIFVELQGLKPLALIHVGWWHLPPFTWVGNGWPLSRQVHNRAEFDPRTDVVDDSGGEIGILFRVVNEQGDLGQADFFLRVSERRCRCLFALKEREHRCKSVGQSFCNRA